MVEITTEVGEKSADILIYGKHVASVDVTEEELVARLYDTEDPLSCTAEYREDR